MPKANTAEAANFTHTRKKIGSDAWHNILTYESRQARLCHGDTLGILSHWKEKSLFLGLAKCTSCLNWGALLCVLTEVLGLQILSSRDKTRGTWHISPDSDVSTWK